MTEASPDDLAAASDRAQQVFADLERLDMTALSRLSLSLRDVEARAPARKAAVLAAEWAGLGQLLKEARLAARDYVSGVYDSAPFRAYGVDVGKVRSRASVDDRVAAMMAAEDAVIAAVAAPFVDEDVRDELSTPMDRLRPAWEIGDPVPSWSAERLGTLTRWSTYVVFVALLFGSLLLLALGSGVGLFGLAAAIGIALVALVVRGRPDP